MWVVQLATLSKNRIVTSFPTKLNPDGKNNHCSSSLGLYLSNSITIVQNDIMLQYCNNGEKNGYLCYKIANGNCKQIHVQKIKFLIL